MVSAENVWESVVLISISCRKFLYGKQSTNERNMHMQKFYPE